MTYLPTTRDEEWRYADPVALAELAPEALDAWKEITLAPGEDRPFDVTIRALTGSTARDVLRC